MTSCIGRMGGGDKDWFAELDFDAEEATVVRRGKGGYNIGPIATVPLGEVYPEDDEYGAELMDDEQNRNLMLIVFGPEIVQMCKSIRDRAKKAAVDLDEAMDNMPKPVTDRVHPAWVALEEISNDLDTIEETLSVPEPDNPKHLAEVDQQGDAP